MSAISLRRRPSVTTASAREAKQVLQAQGVLKIYAVWLFVAALIVTVALKSEQLLTYIDSPVAVIEVSGDLQQVSHVELNGVLDHWLETSFLSADLETIKATVEAMPWVKSAVVSRAWPDQLSVNVEEQVAVANWGHDAYLNPEGVVFKPSIVSLEFGRPMLLGPVNAPLSTRLEMMNKAAQLQVALSEVDLHVDSLSLNERGAWDLGIANGPVVALGAEHEADRLQRALHVVSKMNPDALVQVERLDARYTNGVAVRWKALEVVSGYDFVSSALR